MQLWSVQGGLYNSTLSIFRLWSLFLFFMSLHIFPCNIFIEKGKYHKLWFHYSVIILLYLHNEYHNQTQRMFYNSNQVWESSYLQLVITGFSLADRMTHHWMNNLLSGFIWICHKHKLYQVVTYEPLVSLPWKKLVSCDNRGLWSAHPYDKTCIGTCWTLKTFTVIGTFYTFDICPLFLYTFLASKLFL